ncbi:hypothetical protein IV417_06935 [Alphaproteobacteria bacterium KMM 3653]|uniref:Uncharacterized protein n=1 Tax=Harenicola maris TaxID=2841044 RepID=A0AAP2CMN2_9RHOB|nr:hypothetical protein [Harenicola maris]
MDFTANDPKGLIYESFRIEGITEAECRVIFLDWALGLPMGADESVEIQGVLDHYAAQPEDHPMKSVLREGLAGKAAPTKRRGGRAGRFSRSS